MKRRNFQTYIQYLCIQIILFFYNTERRHLAIVKISTLLKTTATILCALIIISGFNLFLLMHDIKKETEALKLDKEMEVLATQLQGASD